MAFKRQSIAEWLQQAIDDVEVLGKGDCHAFAVVHLTNEGAAQKEVDRITLPAQLSVRDIGARFEQRVEQYVYDLPGHQAFKLYAFYGASTEPGAEFPFARAGTLKFPTNVTEAANKDGLLAQTMRHHENMAAVYAAAQKELIASFAQLARSAVENNAALADEAAQLRRELADARSIMMETAAAHERSVNEASERQRKDEESALMRKKFLELAPALINTITGKKVFPEATEDTSIINTLLDSMGPEHINLLIGIVQNTNPMFAGILSARANEIYEKRKALEVARGEALAIIGPGAPADAEGELQ
jgi:hypothetical protein